MTVEPIRWKGDRLELLDQRLLPDKTIYVTCRTADEVASAIRDMVVRGVVTDRLPSNLAVREVMSEDIYFCFEDDSLEDAAELMAQHQVRRIPVLDRDRRLVGVLALADLARTGPDAAERALEGICEPTHVPRR